MTFQEIIQKALEVRKKYAEFEAEKYGKSWSTQDLLTGFVGDVGDLSKLIQAKNGTRSIENIDEKLKHELADCLWSIIVLSDAHNIDLENAFIETMEELEQRI